MHSHAGLPSRPPPPGSAEQLALAGPDLDRAPELGTVQGRRRQIAQSPAGQPEALGDECGVGPAAASAMAEAGVERFVEFGGKVVGPMIRRSARDVETASVIGMDDIEALAREL